jgi:hypothetical protein
MISFWFGIVPALLIVGYMLVRILQRGLQMKALCHRGVLIRGVIIDHTSFRSGSGLSRHTLRYEYTLPDGRRFTHQLAAGTDEVQRWPVGTALDVVYLPERPAVSGTRDLVNQARKALKLPPI